jgi:hypothetical protein
VISRPTPVSLILGCALIILPACSSSRSASDTCTVNGKPFRCVSSGEKRKLDKLLAVRLQEAKALKARDLARNRLLLEAMPTFPRSRLIGARNAPLSAVSPSSSEQDDRFYEYARAVLSADKYGELIATAWVSEKSYLLPDGVKAHKIRDFFVSRLRGTWRLVREEGFPGAVSMRDNGVGSYELRFAGRGSCLAIHVGVAEPPRPREVRGVDIDIVRMTDQTC